MNLTGILSLLLCVLYLIGMIWLVSYVMSLSPDNLECNQTCLEYFTDWEAGVKYCLEWGCNYSEKNWSVGK